MRIFSIVGHKNAGKTTLLVALAKEFARRGKRVATIKHSSEPVDIDRQGTDSWRHLHEGMADGVLIAAPNLRVTLERRPDDTGPIALALEHFADRDLVIVEGFKRSPLPKIEVYRTGVGPSPLALDPSIPGPWIALATDKAVAEAPCPVLKFTDPMWLQLLASLALERALDPST